MLAGTQEDNVSNLHRRWSFTQLSPSSFRQSFTGSMICGTILVLLAHFYYLRAEPVSLAPYVALGAGVLAALHFADYHALRGTPVNKLSKVGHVSLFANALWLLTAILGIASDSVFSKSIADLDYIVAGMFLAAGLRVGIFTSVFGASLGRASLVSFLMPVVFIFVFVPAGAYSGIFSSYLGAVFGVALYLLGIAWVTVTDRAARPIVPSTFGLLQAFLSAWTENDPTEMEKYIEARAQDEVVGTSVVRFRGQGDGQFAGVIVLPDIHPGPFGTIGGSNLPYVLYEKYSKKALVMHSISDHSLNIPSKHEVERYLDGLGVAETSQRGDKCTHPAQAKVGRSTSTGIAFGSTAVVMLSLSPYGMEDVPQSVRAELEEYATKLGFSDVLLIDSHNAMGKQLSEDDRTALLSCAKQCLDELISRPQEKFRIGFSNLEDASISLHSGELGQAGIAVLVIDVGGSRYAICWADSNNMENGLRDQIASMANNGISILEVCTSDTHSTSGKRTREGYYALGATGESGKIASAFEAVAIKAAERAKNNCSFEFARSNSKVRLMGTQQFEDYSKALDKSMGVTKIFLGVTAAVYVAMLVLV